MDVETINIRGSEKVVISKRITSINNGHRHTWKLFNKRTSIDSGHSHPIDFNNKIAKKGKTNHTHRLLVKVF